MYHEDARSEGLARTLLLSFMVLVVLLWMGDGENKPSRRDRPVRQGDDNIESRLDFAEFSKVKDFFHFEAYTPAVYLASEPNWIFDSQGDEVEPVRLPVLANTLWCHTQDGGETDCDERFSLGRIPIYSTDWTGSYSMEILEDDICGNNCDPSHACVKLNVNGDKGKPLCVPEPQSDIIAQIGDALYYNSICEKKHFVSTMHLSERCAKRKLEDISLIESMDFPFDNVFYPGQRYFPLCHTEVRITEDGVLSDTGVKYSIGGREIYNSLIVLPSMDLQNGLVEIGFDLFGDMLIRGVLASTFMDPRTYIQDEPTSCEVTAPESEYQTVVAGMKSGWAWVPPRDMKFVVAGDSSQWHNTRITVDLRTGRYIENSVYRSFDTYSYE